MNTLQNPRLSVRAGSSYIPTLDGWRCIAITLVLLAHTYAWLAFGTARLAAFLHYPGIANHIARSGTNGVNIFFCLSGFLITTRLLDQGVTLETFYIRRAFRILPAALVYLAVVAALGLLGVIAVDSQQIVASLLFYRNYLDTYGWYTGHYWSLSIEEQFYLMWPFVLAVAKIKRAHMLALVGIFGVVIWRQMNWPLPDHVGYHHTGIRLDSILCGSVMALSWSAVKPAVQKAPRFVIPVALAGFLLADLWSYELQGFTDFIQSVLICVLIASTVANPAGWQSRILEYPLLTWVGRTSYSIYLWQELFLPPAFLHSVPTPHWQLPLRLFGAFFLAWLSYRFIERPMIAMGQRIVAARKAKQLAPDEAQLNLINSN